MKGKYKLNKEIKHFVIKQAGVFFKKDSAFIDVSQLTGMIHGIKLEFIIRENDTFDLISDTNIINNLLDNLAEKIGESSVVGYQGRYILGDLKFEDENGGLLYLEVEHQKPIDRLSSIFEKVDSRKSASKNALSVIDKLFNLGDKTEILTVNSLSISSDVEPMVNKLSISSDVEPMVNKDLDGFFKSEFDKILEENRSKLLYKKEQLESKLSKEISDREMSLLKSEYSLILDRLKSLDMSTERIPYVFTVSKSNQDINIDQYEIRLYNESELSFGENSILYESLLNKVRKIDDSVDSIFSENESVILYSGILNYNTIINTMVQLGFTEAIL